MRSSNGPAVEGVAAAVTVDVVVVVVVPGDPVLMARSEIYTLTTRETSPPCRELARYSHRVLVGGVKIFLGLYCYTLYRPALFMFELRII